MSSTPALSQARDGATLTVLRDQVAVIRPDGSAVQPAPSGTIVRAGDELRTLSATGALITFFSGTEIEMGEDTILVVERVSRQGDQVDVSLKQVFGATLHRVQSLTDAASAYRVEAGGAVAVVRGTTFFLLGPFPTTKGNVVVLVCMEDCDRLTTFAGIPLAPFTGYFIEVDRGRTVGSVQTFKVDRAVGYWQNLWEGATIFEQLEQGDTRRRPAGEVPAGQQEEIGNRLEQEEREQDEEDQQQQQTPPSGPASGPSTLRGLVTNAATGQPLQGVAVEITGASAVRLDADRDETVLLHSYTVLRLAAPSTVADGNGRFALTDVPTGSQVVQFSAPGFRTVTVSLNVVPGENPELTIGLAPIAAVTATPTSTPTVTATATLTPLPSGTPTPTSTLAPPNTPSPTPTGTLTPTSTSTLTPTATATIVPGSISALKYEDANVNGSQDNFEGMLAGWNIFIDVDGDATHDASEPFATTNGSGIATFPSVAPGTYSVCEELQAFWLYSDPDPTTNSTPCKTVTVTSNATSAVTFGNWFPT